MENKTLQDVQKSLDQCVLVWPVSHGGTYSTSVSELVDKGGKKGKGYAGIVYMTIPEVTRVYSNIRAYAEANCLLRTGLGQYVMSEEKFLEMNKRLQAGNDEIETAVQQRVDNYDDEKARFESEQGDYLKTMLGAKAAKPVLERVMANYPSIAKIQCASVRIASDYVSGSNTGELGAEATTLIDESKAMETAERYQNMVLRAVSPMWSKLGQLINQDLVDKMKERTLTAYRACVKQLKDDNIILGNHFLEQLSEIGFMAVGNSDYAEMILAAIWNMAKVVGMEEGLPEIERYDAATLNRLIEEDGGLPSIDELVVKAREIKSESEEA